MFVARTLLPHIVLFVMLSFAFLGLVSPEVHAHDQINCATRPLSLPTQFVDLNVPPLAIDEEHAHYASFDATLAKFLTNYEFESLGPMYGVKSGDGGSTSKVGCSPPHFALPWNTLHSVRS
jgi:hypothetical protein